MHVERHAIAITTAADGSATAYTSAPVTGRILTLVYTKTDFDNGSTITVTTDATGQSVWAETGVNASTTRSPRLATCSIAGAASLYATGGAAVNDHIYAANERIKVVVASGGNVKTGTITVLVG